MKILISDFDNTFYTTEFEQNIKAIQKFVSKGNLFVIATGRNLDYLLSDLKEYKVLVSYYICNDGASIYDNNFDLLYEKNIDKKIVVSLFETLQNNPFFDDILMDFHNGYILDTSKSANKIIARPIGSLAIQEFETIKEMFPTIKGYFSEKWLNMMDKTVDKGNAIRFLAQNNHWLEENIYTIGDSENDILMNKMYQGYAVECAIEALKNISIKTVSNIRELISMIENSK